MPAGGVDFNLIFGVQATAVYTEIAKITTKLEEIHALARAIPVSFVVDATNIRTQIQAALKTPFVIQTVISHSGGGTKGGAVQPPPWMTHDPRRMGTQAPPTRFDITKGFTLGAPGTGSLDSLLRASLKNEIAIAGNIARIGQQSSVGVSGALAQAAQQSSSLFHTHGKVGRGINPLQFSGQDISVAQSMGLRQMEVMASVGKYKGLVLQGSSATGRWGADTQLGISNVFEKFKGIDSKKIINALGGGSHLNQLASIAAQKDAIRAKEMQVYEKILGKDFSKQPLMPGVSMAMTGGMSLSAPGFTPLPQTHLSKMGGYADVIRSLEKNIMDVMNTAKVHGGVPRLTQRGQQELVMLQKMLNIRKMNLANVVNSPTGQFQLNQYLTDYARQSQVGKLLGRLPEPVSQVLDPMLEARGGKTFVSQRFQKSFAGVNKELQSVGMDLQYNKRTGEIKGINAALDDHRRSLQQTAIAMARYMVASTLVFGSVRMITGAFKQMTDAQTDMVEIQKVMIEQGVKLPEIQNNILNVAKDYGVSFKAASQSAIEFARQGFSLPETMQMTRATAFASTTTTMGNASETSSNLIAILRQFKMPATDALHVVQAIGEAEMKHAVTGKQLADALRLSGSAAKAMGVNFHEAIGIATALGEVTQKAGTQVGNSMKMIFSRLYSKESKALLEGANIGVERKGGGLLGGTEILGSLAAKWKDLTDAQKVNYAITIAGRHRLNDFIVLLESWDLAMQAKIESEQSSISSTVRHKMTMETLARQVQNLKTEFTALALAIGQGGAVSGLSGITRGLTSAMQLFNKAPDSVRATTSAIIGLVVALKGLSMLTSMKFSTLALAPWKGLQAGGMALGASSVGAGVIGGVATAGLAYGAGQYIYNRNRGRNLFGDASYSQGAEAIRAKEAEQTGSLQKIYIQQIDMAYQKLNKNAGEYLELLRQMQMGSQTKLGIQDVDNLIESYKQLDILAEGFKNVTGMQINRTTMQGFLNEIPEPLPGEIGPQRRRLDIIMANAGRDTNRLYEYGVQQASESRLLGSINLSDKNKDSLDRMLRAENPWRVVGDQQRKELLMKLQGGFYGTLKQQVGVGNKPALDIAGEGINRLLETNPEEAYKMMRETGVMAGYGMPAMAASENEIEAWIKIIQDNKKELDKLKAAAKDLQTTFDKLSLQTLRYTTQQEKRNIAADQAGRQVDMRQRFDNTMTRVMDAMGSAFISTSGGDRGVEAYLKSAMSMAQTNRVLGLESQTQSNATNLLRSRYGVINPDVADRAQYLGGDVKIMQSLLGAGTPDTPAVQAQSALLRERIGKTGLDITQGPAAGIIGVLDALDEELGRRGTAVTSLQDADNAASKVTSVIDNASGFANQLEQHNSALSDTLGKQTEALNKYHEEIIQSGERSTLAIIENARQQVETGVTVWQSMLEKPAYAMAPWQTQALQSMGRGQSITGGAIDQSRMFPGMETAIGSYYGTRATRAQYALSENPAEDTMRAIIEAVSRNARPLETEILRLQETLMSSFSIDSNQAQQYLQQLNELYDQQIQIAQRAQKKLDAMENIRGQLGMTPRDLMMQRGAQEMIRNMPDEDIVRRIVRLNANPRMAERMQLALRDKAFYKETMQRIEAGGGYDYWGERAGFANENDSVNELVTSAANMQNIAAQGFSAATGAEVGSMNIIDAANIFQRLYQNPPEMYFNHNLAVNVAVDFLNPDPTAFAKDVIAQIEPEIANIVSKEIANNGFLQATQ